MPRNEQEFEMRRLRNWVGALAAISLGGLGTFDAKAQTDREPGGERAGDVRGSDPAGDVPSGLKIEWRVANPFRFFANPRDTGPRWW